MGRLVCQKGPVRSAGWGGEKAEELRTSSGPARTYTTREIRDAAFTEETRAGEMNISFLTMSAEARQ